MKLKNKIKIYYENLKLKKRYKTYIDNLIEEHKHFILNADDMVKYELDRGQGKTTLASIKTIKPNSRVAIFSNESISYLFEVINKLAETKVLKKVKDIHCYKGYDKRIIIEFSNGNQCIIDFFNKKINKHSLLGKRYTYVILDDVNNNENRHDIIEIIRPRLQPLIMKKNDALKIISKPQIIDIYTDIKKHFK